MKVRAMQSLVAKNADQLDSNILEVIDTVRVLDKGYVKFIDSMGNDLSIVNAARASFEKESKEFSKSDAGLIRFLAREGHMSPFRHGMFTFEFKAPMMVARQHWKYVVGSDHTMDSWNEGSRRYVTADPDFYIPDNMEWRSAPDDKKQGSGGPLGRLEGEMLTQALEDCVLRGEQLYNWAMELGVAPEQARLFLPAYGMFLHYRWTCSVQSLTHFLRERLAHDAQSEITEFARATYQLSIDRFPVSMQALLGDLTQW